MTQKKNDRVRAPFSDSALARATALGLAVTLGMMSVASCKPKGNTKTKSFRVEGGGDLILDELYAEAPSGAEASQPATDTAPLKCFYNVPGAGDKDPKVPEERTDIWRDFVGARDSGKPEMNQAENEGPVAITKYPILEKDLWATMASQEGDKFSSIRAMGETGLAYHESLLKALGVTQTAGSGAEGELNLTGAAPKAPPKLSKGQLAALHRALEKTRIGKLNLTAAQLFERLSADLARKQAALQTMKANPKKYSRAVRRALAARVVLLKKHVTISEGLAARSPNLKLSVFENWKAFAKSPNGASLLEDLRKQKVSAKSLVVRATRVAKIDFLTQKFQGAARGFKGGPVNVRYAAIATAVAAAGAGSAAGIAWINAELKKRNAASGGSGSGGAGASTSATSSSGSSSFALADAEAFLLAPSEDVSGSATDAPKPELGDEPTPADADAGAGGELELPLDDATVEKLEKADAIFDDKFNSPNVKVSASQAVRIKDILSELGAKGSEKNKTCEDMLKTVNQRYGLASAKAEEAAFVSEEEIIKEDPSLSDSSGGAGADEGSPDGSSGTTTGASSTGTETGSATKQ